MLPADMHVIVLPLQSFGIVHDIAASTLVPEQCILLGISALHKATGMNAARG